MKNKRGWYIIIDIILSVMCLMLFLQTKEQNALLKEQNERNCQLLTVLNDYIQQDSNDIREQHYYRITTELEQIKDLIKPIETVVIPSDKID